MSSLDRRARFGMSYKEQAGVKVVRAAKKASKERDLRFVRHQEMNVRQRWQHRLGRCCMRNGTRGSFSGTRVWQ